MKKNVIIYTAIFGGYDTVTDPTFIPDNADFVCFTDSDIKSDIWNVIKVPAIYEDSTRNARKYKVLPHRWFPDYEYSIWIDGNIMVREDINELIAEWLDDANLAIPDHAQNILDPRDCVYKEAQTILQLGQKNGNFKDDPQTMVDQMNRYIQDDFEGPTGLAVSMQVLRRHNEADCISAMEKWWKEISYGSKRDQLSFNYAMWKEEFKYNYLPSDSRDNKYFLNMGAHTGKKKKDNTIYEPINLDYFLQMEVQPGGGGKEICHKDGELKTTKDIIEYWKNEKNVEDNQSKLNPNNWQYFNCMMAGFKKNVADHHELGWDKLTREYYDSLEDMSDEELRKFLTNTPAEFDNGYIRHSMHRAYAMIGRLIQGKKYIPFYMEKEKIYDKPRIKDGKHRIKPLSHNVYGIKEVLNLGIPASEFTITQSGILALMGIRKNDDIDIIISSKIRNELFNGDESFMRLPNGIEIFEKGKGKFMHFGATDEDDLINKFSFNVGGINFLEPRFYFRKKRKDRDKDKRDWEGIYKFIDMDGKKGYPWNQLSKEQWGI